jgi:hypothetical protein
MPSSSTKQRPRSKVRPSDPNRKPRCCPVQLLPSYGERHGRLALSQHRDRGCSAAEAGDRVVHAGGRAKVVRGLGPRLPADRAHITGWQATFPCPLKGRPTAHRRRSARATSERKRSICGQTGRRGPYSIQMAALRSGPVPHRRRHLPLASKAVWVRSVPAPKPISRHLRFQRP